MEAQSNGYVNELKKQLIDKLEVVVIPEMSEFNEQCIYKVSQIIRKHNPQAYTPQIISIGPFHNPRGTISDNNSLQQMEEFKLKYLKEFLNRTNLSVDYLVFRVQKWENRIRNCYAGPISFGSKDFLNIIIVDACFIIELFLRCCSYTDWEENDPILSKTRLYNDIFYDLILLENQLPFFVLDQIYKFANITLELPSFITITSHYFQYFNQQNINSDGLHPKNFVDLMRTFLLPSSSFDFSHQEMENKIEHVYSASQLSEAGLVFEVSESKCLFDLTLDKGVLKIPRFELNDETEIYIRNILAFEECHRSYQDSRYISQYFLILDYLINTEEDVSILVDKKIIVNLLSGANEAATMVNNLGNNTPMPRLSSKYLSLCRGLNGFYENPIYKYKAIFVHEYFNTPWKIASTITAVLLVLFTLIQAVCSIWSLVK